MPLGMEVGLGPGYIVLDGAQPPIFGSLSIVAKWLVDQDATWYEGRP